MERIDLWQLHRIDPKVPRDEQFDAIKQMQQEGLILHLGLSEVNVEEVQAAQKFFPVATVQNQYNLAARQSKQGFKVLQRGGEIPAVQFVEGGSGEVARCALQPRKVRQQQIESGLII